MIAKKFYKKNKKNANELDEIFLKRKNDNKTNQKKKLNNSLGMESDLIDAINE
jgi:hemoglobin-like flavoprotein